MEIEIIENIESVLPIFQIKDSHLVAIPNPEVPSRYKILHDIDIQSPIARRMIATGAGFGSPESNRLVENAAISFVTKYYEKHGWLVKSVERDYLGYDLCCTQKKLQEHVEVKGIRGSLVSFIITEREVKCSKTDELFILCAVTEALDNPQLHRLTAKEFWEKFTLKERVKIEYHASLGKREYYNLIE